MIRRYRHLPIKTKLTLIAMLASGAALVVAGVVFVAYERREYRENLVQDVTTLARMTALNVTAAVTFDDADSARQTLEALSAKPHIEAACIFAQDGARFAEFRRLYAPESPWPAGPGQGVKFGDTMLEVFYPIENEGDAIGTLYVRADLAELQHRLRDFALLAAGVIVGASLLAYVIAARLQRMITGPIDSLASAAARVTAERDYSVRATRQGEDELGDLTDAFNTMLAEIEDRDAELRKAQESLERRVQERTSELAEASGLLEAMLENSPDFIYFKDRDSRFVRFSRALLHRLGRQDPAELRGRTDADHFSSEHATEARADEEEIMRTGLPIIGKPERETYPDGRTAWVLTTKMPWRDGAGNIIGTFGISRDITELKEAESRLAHERDLLRALLDSSPDAIYFKDRESRFVLISRSKAQKMLERVPGLRDRLLGPGADPAAPADSDMFKGLSDADTYKDEHSALARADEEEIMRTGRPLIGKTEKQTYLDGSVCWSITNKMPWRDREGRVIGTFGISKDITALKEAEEKLEAVHKELLATSRAAGMAEVATGVLHNVGNVLNSVNVSATLVADGLRHSKAGNVGKLRALLAEHQEDLPRFLAEDPRGRIVLPYLGTLADDLAKEQQAMLTELDQLRKNVDHIKDIVAMQQSYAKTSGVVEVVSAPDLIEDALRMNAGSLARHDVDIAREYQARPVLPVDKHKVLQILINLVRNAKYACDESGRTDKRITMGLRTDDEFVRISVQDNGVGIPPENLTRIFNHGFTTRAHGHGFGLHSGALAAKEMGGSLEVFSEGRGKGATFTLALPLKPDEPEAAP
ncbi:MAG TPA: PAS domain-containing protein [Opitutaceae bacterium]|nr:PAS domain-containing protein [Opitutaceae bacterium]